MPSDRPEYNSTNVVEFRTTQCKPLKILFDALKENMPDVSIYFTREGLSIYSLDSGRTLLINVSLLEENFDHFYCKEEYNDEGEPIPIQINVSVHNVNKVLKTISNEDDMLIWTYSPQKRDKGKESLTISISSSNKAEERIYKVTLQEPDDDPEAGMITDDVIDDYDYLLTMPCADFQRICKDLKNMNTERVTLQHKGQELIFSSASDIAEASIIRNGLKGDNASGREETDLIFCKLPEETSCYTDDFKFESLYNFGKCANIGCKTGKIVKIHLRKTKPIILKFKVGKLGEILFALAPIDEEE